MSVGSNVYQAFPIDGIETLLSMPTKFRDTIYISNGMFALAFEILENDKIWGEIQHILFPDQIENIKAHNMWPHEFDDIKKESKPNESYIDEDLLPSTSSESEEYSSSEESCELKIN